MKTRSQAANGADPLVVRNSTKPLTRLSKPVVAIHTRPKSRTRARTKPIKSPEKLCQVIIPSLPMVKKAVKPEPKPILQPKKPSQTLSGNLMDLEPLEKEQSIRQWVDSQRCISVPAEDPQRELTPHDDFQETAKVIPHSEELPIETNKEISRMDGLARSESTSDHRQEPPSSVNPAREPAPTSSNLPLKVIEHPGPADLDGPGRKRVRGQVIRSPTRDQRKNQLDAFESGTTQVSSSQISPKSTGLEFKPKINQHSPSNVMNGQTFSITDGSGAVGLTQNEEHHSGSSGSDPFGFIHAERELAQGASTSREESNPVGNATVSRSEQVNPTTKCTFSPDAQAEAQQDQPHQLSDLSLGDLLNINKKNKKGRPLRSKKITATRGKTSKDTDVCASSSHSNTSLVESSKGTRIGQPQKRHPKKANQTHVRNLRDRKPRHSVENEEISEPGETETVNPEPLSSHERTHECMAAGDKTNETKQVAALKKKKNGKTRTRKKSHSNYHQHDENSVLTPIVMINNSKKKMKNLRNRSVLQPRTTNPNLAQVDDRHRDKSVSKEKLGVTSKSSARKRSKDDLNIDDDHHHDEEDSPPPDRKARLSYYKNLDNLSLEEEVVI